MATDNLISLELSKEELDKLNHLLSQIEELLKDKFINLTPSERAEYARVGNRTEGWITRVKQYMEQYPQLVLQHINTAEHAKDYNTRHALLPVLRRLEAITQRVDDTLLLIGTDLYNNSIAYYKGLKAAAATNAPNAKSAYTDLKTQFPTGRSTKKSDDKPITE